MRVLSAAAASVVFSQNVALNSGSERDFLYNTSTAKNKQNREIASDFFLQLMEFAFYWIHVIKRIVNDKV